MDGIPPATQPAGTKIRLVAHCQQERAHGFPVRRRETTLDVADRRLRDARAARESTLAQPLLLATLSDQTSWGRHDI